MEVPVGMGADPPREQHRETVLDGAPRRTPWEPGAAQGEEGEEKEMDGWVGEGEIEDIGKGGDGMGQRGKIERHGPGYVVRGGRDLRHMGMGKREFRMEKLCCGSGG